MTALEFAYSVYWLYGSFWGFNLFGLFIPTELFHVRPPLNGPGQQ